MPRTCAARIPAGPEGGKIDTLDTCGLRAREKAA